MGLLPRFLRDVIGAKGRLRALALGSCRVHDPLIAAHALGQIDYLNIRIRSPTPIYLHDVHEMIQFLCLLTGNSCIPAKIAPFAFRDWQPARRLSLITRIERLVIEVCTDKHYEVMGYTLNINEIHRQIVQPAGESGQAWWSDAHRGQSAPTHVIEDVETALRGCGKLTDAHSQILRELTLVTLPAASITSALRKLQALVSCSILVVPHIAARLGNGHLLAERMEHIDKIIEAAGESGLAVLDPRSFLERHGQERVLGNNGRDLHHYASDYLPIVGREIVRSLRAL